MKVIIDESLPYWETVKRITKLLEQEDLLLFGQLGGRVFIIASASGKPVTLLPNQVAAFKAIPGVKDITP